MFLFVPISTPAWNKTQARNVAIDQPFWSKNQSSVHSTFWERSPRWNVSKVCWRVSDTESFRGKRQRNSIAPSLLCPFRGLKVLPHTCAVNPARVFSGIHGEHNRKQFHSRTGMLRFKTKPASRGLCLTRKWRYLKWIEVEASFVCFLRVIKSEIARLQTKQNYFKNES